MEKLSDTEKSNNTSSPRKKYDVNMEQIEAINKGNNETNVRSRLNTSMAKTIPAMGDLNIDAIAPAVAQAMSSVLVFRSTCSNLLKLELNAEPEVMAGPIRPTDPPKPMVKGAKIKGR